MSLNIIHEIPQGFFEWHVEEIHQYLNGPTLIHLHPQKKNPLFVSTLLHGNEHSGFLAIQEVLNTYVSNSSSYERSMIVFIGNTKAAQSNQRKCANENDFNRVWSGGECELALIAREVKDYVEKSSPFACIDIHNNTGHNPFYSCITNLESEHLELAHYFADQIVYFTEPSEVLSNAFVGICPSITIEAGQSRQAEGVTRLIEKILSLLKEKNLNLRKDRSKYKVVHTIGRIRPDENATIDFDFDINSRNDLSFRPDIDLLNFQVLKCGSVIAQINRPSSLVVENNYGENVFHEYFKIDGKSLKLIKSFIPAMLTKNIQVIHDDCMGYIMEDYPHN